MEGEKWHSMSQAALYSRLSSRQNGLSEKSAEDRLLKFGHNEIKEIKKESPFAMFLRQFKSLPIIMLIAAALISFFLGLTFDSNKLIDAVAIMVAVALAVSFSFFQEYKAERALEALKRMVVTRSVVVRGGKEILMESRKLVPGDIVVLEEGNRVPADMRIIESVNLAADQSILTGESRPSEKESRTSPSRAVLSDRKNMLFSGTVVVRGHCRGMVVETGMSTEFGKIVSFVGQSEEKETTLQKNLTELSKTLGYAGIFLALLFFIIGMLRGESAASMFIVAVTLAVAVIPEGLPTVLAITLALGVQKMAKKNAIVRKMPAVETLGSATVICTDKTGTITQNKMTVQEIVLYNKTYAIGKCGLDLRTVRRDPTLQRAVEIMALCNNAMLVEEEGKSKLVGDPTETALLTAVTTCRNSESRLRDNHRLIGEVPFDSDRKMMSTIRLFGNKRLALVKGAPEKVLLRCNAILTPEGERRMTPDYRNRMLSESHSFGEEGMRMLALAYRPIAKIAKYNSSNTEKSLIFVGLVAMEDPLRPEVPDAIALCHSAGIRVMMITGDSLSTARAIAAKAGLLVRGSKIYDGSRLEGMNEEDIERIVVDASVFARVTPEQKYRIVSALMRLGEIVAVTGDGVNDAPAIKKANIGVAMGISGTDVTKEVSDIVLTDDNFASVVNAVKYGRTIFNNIKSFVRYQISTNVAAIGLMFAAPALALPLPLLPLHLLWINIMVDGPPALALGAESPSNEEMRRPPRNPKASFMSRNLVLSIFLLGILMASISFAVFGYYLSYAPEKALTVVFTLFVFLQLLNALNCRSASDSFVSRAFSNPWLFAAIIVSLLLHMAIIFFQPLQVIFKTVPLLPEDFALIIGAASLILIFEELKKKFFKHTTVY